MPTKSNDFSLDELLTMVERGKVQLPDFQRSWVWNDERIRKLIESISLGFPMGAPMFLETGGEVRFPYRVFEGAPSTPDKPQYLALDGQQRLTTLYQVFKSSAAVSTRNAVGGKGSLKRHYYLDINKCLDPDTERLDAIVSIDEDKTKYDPIKKETVLDLSTREKEFETMMFPLNILFDSDEYQDWGTELMDYGGKEKYQTYKKFRTEVLANISKYALPVITVDRETSKDAVCQIFENVNTGGVSLTVFELVTASLAAEEFNLREDWDKIVAEFKESKSGDLLTAVENTSFLTAMALLVSYKRYLKNDKHGAVSCKKKDVLKLNRADYEGNRDSLVKGFIKAGNFLINQGVFSADAIPYKTQLVPLAVMMAVGDEAGINFNIQTNKDKLARWYWCGVFGRIYSSSSEALFPSDVVDTLNYIGGGNEPSTITEAVFPPTRLLSMQTRGSAGYLGIMALILQDSPLDFMSANKMDIAAYLDERTDIHHIFPEHYCKGKGYQKEVWNSVINKTPIYASTNRSIGGRAPSEYIVTMANKGLSQLQMCEAISSHKVNYDLLKSDDFNGFIIDRACRLLDRIETAMGKKIVGRDSDEVVKAFGQPLTTTAAAGSAV